MTTVLRLRRYEWAFPTDYANVGLVLIPAGTEVERDEHPTFGEVLRVVHRPECVIPHYRTRGVEVDEGDDE